jgi:Flp pilus assembly pilin Flp
MYIGMREYLVHLGKGQTMTEYALILGAVAMVVFVSYHVMGQDIGKKILRIADILEDAT